MAEKMENAKCDLVAARFSRIWKGIHLPKQSVSPCFQHGEKLYNHGQIISELYVSFLELRISRLRFMQSYIKHP